MVVSTLADELSCGQYTTPGIFKGEDGIYDIVIDTKEITKDVVIRALQEFSEKIGIEYAFDMCGTVEP